MKLNNKLKDLSSYPFHMPGHKRNPRFNILGSEIDITEITSFDNLHNAVGVLRDIENRLERHYQSNKSYMLINGSTVGILSAIFAVCNEGDKIIVARNCHKSVFNACMLRHLKVTYIEPEYDAENGFYTRINQVEVNKTISANPEAKAIVITSPTYEGYISTIKTDIPLIIDAAHGAHLGLGYFPKYPEGDIVISSLHKTLPALTQTAVVNIYNGEFIGKVKLYLDIFETSSPSYVLMNSVDLCFDYIETNTEEFKKYYDRLNIVFSQSLSKLRIRNTDDRSKIIVSTANTNISGKRLTEMLREDFNIEAEAFSNNYVILMTSVADSEEALRKLAVALLTIDDANYEVELAKPSHFEKPPCPDGYRVIAISDNSIEADFDDAVGETANEFVFAYPPDIPLIVPNEIISEEIIKCIKKLYNNGVNIISDSGLMPNKILTKDAN